MVFILALLYAIANPVVGPQEDYPRCSGERDPRTSPTQAVVCSVPGPSVLEILNCTFSSLYWFFRMVFFAAGLMTLFVYILASELYVCYGVFHPIVSRVGRLVYSRRIKTVELDIYSRIKHSQGN